MPKELSHILIARKVLDQLKGTGPGVFAQVIESNVPAFYLGAIIPDAFFYDMVPLSRFFEGYYKVSRALHSEERPKNDERAVAFFDTIRTRPHAWPSKIAFASGIVAHTVSDRIIHEVIDHYTTKWSQRGLLAMATHRELETLIDMVLLEELRLHPRKLQLRDLVNVDRPTELCLLRFYVGHLVGDSTVRHGPLLSACRMACAQQRLFLKLFMDDTSYHIMYLLNRLGVGKLTAWSSLFYPRTVENKNFPIMSRIDLNALTDGQSFAGTLASLVDQVTIDTVSHISVGLQKL